MIDDPSGPPWPMLSNPNFLIDVIRAAAKSCDIVTTRGVSVRAGLSPRAS